MLLFIAALVGANTVISRYLNTIFARHNGLTMGNLANYVTGLTTALLALWVIGEPWSIQPVGVLTFRTVMMFLGGAVGVVIIQLFIYITPRMPAFLATLLLFLSQLGMGLVLDGMISGEISLGKLLGGLMVLLGLMHYALTGRRDMREERKT